MPAIQINSSKTSKPKFHWGDKRELNRYIQVMKEGSYPLIWLLPSINRYEGIGGQSVTKECSFIIATRETRKSLFNNERYLKSFDFVLNPLTSNLIHGLSSSNITSRIGNNHETLNEPNYSEDDGESNGTIDLWDAISLTINVRFTSNIKNLKPIIYETS
ncbi:hypothetical protein [uncultured Winogradskyella sp.]|uniref:hypothetical protein n=1 Tax=uncultured Winogradskyella sp. TaxID=395353 RepID=UPI0030ED1EFE